MASGSRSSVAMGSSSTTGPRTWSRSSHRRAARAYPAVGAEAEDRAGAAGSILARFVAIGPNAVAQLISAGSRVALISIAHPLPPDPGPFLVPGFDNV